MFQFNVNIIVMYTIHNFLFPLILTLVNADNFSFLLPNQYGPLYGGMKLLIKEEQQKASSIWNETEIRINNTLKTIHNGLDHVNQYNIIVQSYLNEFYELDQSPEFQNCFKKYERDVAHFNRDLLDKYNVCTETLNTALTFLKNETFEELKYLRNGTHEIANVTNICTIQHLKHASKNQSATVYCILSHIGKIDQRLQDSSQLCLDVVSQISAVNEDTYADSCQGFIDLKEQFDQLYKNIKVCIENA